MRSFPLKHLNEGKVVTKKKKFRMISETDPSWLNHLSKTERFRNHEKVRLNLLAQYGEVRSFLFDKYPECRQIKFVKKKEEES